jgi:hypothetical protein
MPLRFTFISLALLSVFSAACGSNNDSTGGDGTSGTGGTSAVGVAGSRSGSAGSPSRAGAGGRGGGVNTGGSGGRAGRAGSANTAAGGAAGSGGSAMTGSAGADSVGEGPGSAELTGTLGDLGALQPTVSAIVISNSGETLIYMSSAPITCQLLSMSRWLGSVAAGSQVVEIVVPSGTTGTLAVQDGAEVNYAPGGMSSAYEQTADSGSVTFTTITPNGVAEGSVTATYTNPTGNVSGTFHAEFCAGGQGY